MSMLLLPASTPCSQTPNASVYQHKRRCDQGYEPTLPLPALEPEPHYALEQEQAFGLEPELVPELELELEPEPHYALHPPHEADLEPTPDYALDAVPEYERRPSPVEQARERVDRCYRQAQEEARARARRAKIEKVTHALKLVHEQPERNELRLHRAKLNYADQYSVRERIAARLCNASVKDGTLGDLSA